jgi:hypothetical protein
MGVRGSERDVEYQRGNTAVQAPGWTLMQHTEIDSALDHTIGQLVQYEWASYRIPGPCNRTVLGDTARRIPHGFNSYRGRGRSRIEFVGKDIHALGHGRNPWMIR